MRQQAVFLDRDGVINRHIITVSHDVLKKLDLVGKDLHEYSLETVRMFSHDGLHAGYHL